MHPHFAEQHARLRQLELIQAAEVAHFHRHRRAVSRRTAVLVAAGRVLVRVGGYLVAGRRPATTPCPWCDGAFPAHRCQDGSGTSTRPVAVGLSSPC